MSVLIAYTPISGSRLSTPEQSQFFIMNALLHSRMEIGYPSNHEFFDEDVNVYLAGLLASRIHPPENLLDGGLSLTDAALFEAASAAPGDRARCELYRAAADALLVSLGVFRNARGRRPGRVLLTSQADTIYVGRGKTYYAIASSLASSLARRPNAVSAVLGKLSRGFERYLAVLSRLAGEHLGIVRGISDGTLYHLEHPAAAVGPAVAAAYDRFLDRYSAYRRNPDARSRRSLEEAVGALRKVDPSFAFDLDSLDRVKSL